MLEKNRFTFSKSERLTHKIVIGKLFSEGHGFICYPFRIVWKTNRFESGFPAKVAITVSKRNFKKAVTRNLIKRRIREIYRLNKCNLYRELDAKEIQIAFMIVYLPKTILSTNELKDKLIKALNRIPKEYEKHTKNSETDNSVHSDSAN